MKTIPFVVLLCIAVNLNAQPDFDKRMSALMEQATNPVSSTDYKEMLKTVRGIARDFPERWEGHYYQAWLGVYAHALNSDPVVREELIQEANKAILQAQEYASDNAEVLVVNGIVNRILSTEFPESAEAYLEQARSALDEAYALAPENPRVLFGMGRILVDGTEPGDAQRGCEMLHEAQRRFAEQSRSETEPYAPLWGADRTDALLATYCND